jgi:hypothetical protein
MKSVRVYLVFWLSGLIAGVILVERWRRNGDIDVAAEPTTPGTLDGSPGSTGPTGPAKKPNLVGLVVTGAKLDAERVRQRVTQAKGPAAGASPATGSADSSAQ